MVNNNIRLYSFLLITITITITIITISLSTYAKTSGSAGIVIIAKGDVQLVRGEISRKLKRKEHIERGDRIITSVNSRASLRMVDNAILTLGANTEFSINYYRYSEKNNEGSARIELLKGVMRAVTGAIGKTKDRDFSLKTPFATLGIRGTDFWAGNIFSNALDVALISGKGVYVENSAGRVEITMAGYGTTIKGQEILPTTPKLWGDKKFKAALESVAVELPSDYSD